MSHLTQVAHELYSIWLGQRTSSFVQQFFYFFPVFCFSGPQIRLITKGEKKKVGLLEREALKPFLLQ